MKKTRAQLAAEGIAKLAVTVNMSPESLANLAAEVDDGDQNVEIELLSPGEGTVVAHGAAIEAVAPEPEMFRTFTDQPLSVLGERAPDNRILATDMDITFRDMPLPLQWCEKNEGGHMNSVTIGVIESMHVKGTQVLGSGYLLNTDDADRCANLLAHKVASPSTDMGAAEWHYTDDKGEKLETAVDIETYLEGGGTLYRKITKGHVMGATLVPFQAIGSASLALNSERESRDVGLVASAAESFRPRVYDHRAFEDPKFSGPTAPHMDETGRMSGHLAVFGQCHRSVQAKCVMVPRSPSGYQHFHTSPPVRLDNGQHLSVGRLTVGTGHADPKLRPAPAAAHYDDTGSCFALVRVGEDAYGIWFSGVAAPWATTEQIEMGLTAPLSGDWRNFGQGLDLVAALAVNTPGFAVQGRDDNDGRPVALVASVGPVLNSGTPAVTKADIQQWIKEALVPATEEQLETETAIEDTVETEAPAAETTSVSPQREAATAITEQEIASGKSLFDQANELLARAGL